MYYIKRIIKYLSGVLFLVLGIVLLNYYKIVTITFLQVLKDVNVNIIWVTFIIVSLPFFKECLSRLYRLIIRFFDIAEKKFFTDGMKLILYKLKLHKRRFIRRFKFLLKSCKPTLLLLPLWIGFIVVLNLFTEKSFFELLDESKFSLFSSIIIACAVAVRDAYYKNKKILNEQFDLYKDFMYLLEGVIYKIIKYNYPNYENAGGINWCYTDERFRKIQGYIVYGEKSVPTSLLKEDLDEMKSELETIKRLLSLGEITTDKDVIYHFIDDILKELNSIRNLEICDKNKLNELCDDLYWWVLEPIRYPWRRDIDLDIKINTILLNKFLAKKTDDDVYFNHYKRLLIDADYSTSYPKPILKVKIRKRETR